jgi:murein DD-endopeptidase MepM/ murein hydrolase activator NlpD
MVRRRAYPALAAALLVTVAPAATKRAPARDPLRVTPSENIETYVREEIAKAEAILCDPAPANLFESPYLVSAVYYHDGFLAAFPSGRADADPSRRIIGHLVRQLRPEVKTLYVAQLRAYGERHEPAASGPRFVSPADYEPLRRSRRRQTHKFAIDLFAREGSPVRSASYGVVVLAEGGWDKDNPLSTTSREGGNTVIIYDASSARFFRYCHLDRVLVRAGDPVVAGAQIATVGHTGRNASRKGHGRHLHFEINQFEDGVVRPLTHAELRDFLRDAAPLTALPTAGTRVGALP